MIDLTRALKYPFSGSNVIAISVIGAILTAAWPLGFVTLFLLLGYQLRIIEDVIAARDDELPAWDRMGDGFIGGVMVFAGTLIYYLPSAILAGVSAWLAIRAVTNLNLTDWVLYRIEPEIDRDKLALVVLCYAAALLWMLVSAPLVMAATARFAETRSFSAFLNVGERFTEVLAERSAAASLMLNLFVLGILTQLVALTLTATLPMTCLFNAYLQFVYFAVVWHLTGQWGLVLKEYRRRTVIRPLR